MSGTSALPLGRPGAERGAGGNQRFDGYLAGRGGERRRGSLTHLPGRVGHCSDCLGIERCGAPEFTGGLEGGSPHQRIGVRGQLTPIGLSIGEQDHDVYKP